jgi:hypothetical protein
VKVIDHHSTPRTGQYLWSMRNFLQYGLHRKIVADKIRGATDSARAGILTCWSDADALALTANKRGRQFSVLCGTKPMI